MIASKIKRENTERRIEANLRLRKHKSGLTRMNLRAFAVCCEMMPKIQISTSERAIWDIILAPISMFDIWPNIIALHSLIPLCYNTHPPRARPHFLPPHFKSAVQYFDKTERTERSNFPTDVAAQLCSEKFRH